jgi:Na+-translocating ferredoxin:NAD+ oxidoreductase subunit E
MSIVKDGILKKNPVFFMLLGLCPALAVTTSIENAIGMGIATTFVLVASGIIISILRNFISEKIRIPAFIVIIATMVTIISLFMEAYIPLLYSQLGIYVPLIVVNCIVFARALSFAYKNKIIPSVVDGLSNGVGFTLALFVIGSIREIIGTGKIDFYGIVINLHLPAIGIFIFPSGALLIMGLVLALKKHIWGEM